MTKKFKDGVEIERKFLIDPKNLPLDSQGNEEDTGYYTDKDYQIFQNYIPSLDGMLRLRYQHRQSRDGRSCSSQSSYLLTAKDGMGLERQEAEIRIPKNIYDVLLSKSQARLSKRRRIFRYRGHNIEIDSFEAELSGLIIAEVEFKTVKAARKFVPPDWFGKEVTEDARYYNENLAQHGRPKNADVN
jgi:adenylate cyclase